MSVLLGLLLPCVLIEQQAAKRTVVVAAYCFGAPPSRGHRWYSHSFLLACMAHHDPHGAMAISACTLAPLLLLLLLLLLSLSHLIHTGLAAPVILCGPFTCLGRTQRLACESAASLLNIERCARWKGVLGCAC
jgi:hypothetical protein